jgi:hypothetical protein
VTDCWFVTSSRWWSRPVHALELRPAGPASLLQQLDQSTGRRRGVERQCVHQLGKWRVDADILDVVLALLVGQLRDASGQLDQPWWCSWNPSP